VEKAKADGPKKADAAKPKQDDKANKSKNEKAKDDSSDESEDDEDDSDEEPKELVHFQSFYITFYALSVGISDCSNGLLTKYARLLYWI
jgi:hypothetical protein